MVKICRIKTKQVLCKLELMCLQLSTNRGLLDLLCANISGLTINGYVDTYLMHPLFSKLVI
jgi:hypothetical protein